MTLEPWATAQAEQLIAPLGDRWTHVQAVADKARGLAAVLSAEDADLLAAAALVHDVGYAPSLHRLGFHAVDGARFLRAQGQERLARLVAHHSGARFEAEERDLVEELAAFPVEDGPVIDALTFADMTTGPTGQSMTLDQRIEEVQRRYRSDDPVLQAPVQADRLGSKAGRPRRGDADPGSRRWSRPGPARLRPACSTPRVRRNSGS
jgi:HD domain